VDILELEKVQWVGVTPEWKGQRNESVNWKIEK
jgi:hypothetical protein